MNDVFLKNLRSGINNSSLMKLGELRFVINANAGYTFNVKAVNRVMTVESGTMNSILVDGVSTLLPWLFEKGSGANGTVDFSVVNNYEENDIRFVDMMNLKSIIMTDSHIDSVLIKGLEGIVTASNNLNELTIANASVENSEGIHVEWFKELQNINKIAFTGAKIFGTIADIPTSCTIFNVTKNIANYNPNLVGDIVEVFGNRRNITLIGLQGSHCTGDIADMADAQANLSGDVHRVSGDIRVLCGNSTITNSSPGATKKDGWIHFTTDTTTYPRGWYWTE